jgi:hypothetical protein
MPDELAPVTLSSLPPNCERIEIHVAELQHLFNQIDPSPPKERDLGQSVEDFIVSWAKDAPHAASFALLVYVDRLVEMKDAPTAVRDAIHTFFDRRALVTRRRLRQLFRVGRTSLVIGLVALALSVGVSSTIEDAMASRHLGAILRESLLIGGWVAMWRPMEVFLYDWWPIRAEARLFDRLSVMPVLIERSKTKLA